ncbi:hypothetical protein ILUMI_26330, partial [Ignelater luminosus]
VLGKSTIKSKHEDSYAKNENDISNGAPILPIEGGYKDLDEITIGSSSENLEKFYDMRSMYGLGSGYDLSAPYYYYIYDPRSLYDPDSRYYMGGSYYDLEKAFYAANIQTAEITTGIPEEVQQTTEMIEESQTSNEENQKSNEKNQKSNEQEEEIRTDSDTIVAYWVPPESDFTGPRIETNPYIMGIPAQVQGFPLFRQYYYQPEYDYEVMIEEEKRREEIEEQGLDANTVENPEDFPHGGRAKRSFARMLNLRSKKEDNAAYVKDRKINGNSDSSVVFNADCRNRGNGNGDGGNGGVGGAGNGIDQAVGAAEGAANDAANAASEAAENLRLRNGRRSSNRRTGNNRNGRGFQQE